jgi:ethylbenzene dioxygenase subunit beta
MTGAQAARIVAAIDWPLYAEVQGFLYHEARLLDGGRYAEWLAVLTDDIHYWMPTIENPLDATVPHRYSPTALAFFDDDRRMLERRVKKLADRTAWTEVPPTRQCRIISNIEVERTAREDEFNVYSAFVHHRGMGERDEFTMAGRREDLLRRGADGLKLAKRLIVVDQHVLLARNLNVFF